MTTYEVRVDRHLDDRWADWFGGVSIRHEPDGTSHVTAEVADQAQLHGLLASLRDLNVGLLGLGPVPAPPGPSLTRPLRTDRLTLRAATAADAEPTWSYRRLPEVSEWLSGTPDDLDTYRCLFLSPDRLAATVTVQLPTGQVIGDFMLRHEDAWAQAEVAERARGRQVELGWVLDPRATGQGFATEAVRELVRYSFEELGARRIIASSFLDNDASWRLMERVGMRRESHAVRDSLHRSGRWLDTVTYALLADERR